MTMTRFAGALAVAGITLLAAVAPSPVAAQEQTAQPSVFLDCNSRNCNGQYFRTEIDWVNWVRDQEAADVFLIFTSVQSGGGGRIYQLDFIGQGDATGYEEQLLIPTLPTDTEREELDRLVDAIALALAQFAVAEGWRDLVEIQIDGLRDMGGGAAMVSPDEVEDPWNLWTFSVRANASIRGEDTRENRDVEGRFSASRVTPTWKMNLRGGFNSRRLDIEVSDGPDVTNEQTDWNFNALAIYALADKWSVGFRTEGGRVIRANQRFRAEAAAALEYSFFPYEEANRRSLTAFYQVGPGFRDYYETTIFGQDEELRWEHAFEVELSQRQRWGDASISARASQFLHDTSLYNTTLEGDINFRVLRGLNLFANGQLRWVEDQIFLAAGGASTEEELLDLVIRGQSFTWRYRFGVDIRFGSIFNNVVNNRFGPGFWW